MKDVKDMSKHFFHWLFCLVVVSLVLFSTACQKEAYEFMTLDLLEDFEFAEIIEETERIDIGDPNVSQYFMDGWSNIEKTGVWATSLTSKIRFFTFLPQRSQEILFRCRPFTYPNSPPQTIEVSLNSA